MRHARRRTGRHLPTRRDGTARVTLTHGRRPGSTWRIASRPRGGITVSSPRRPPVRVRSSQGASMSDWNTTIIEEFRANGGKVGGQFEGAPLLLLHTTGARTGTERTNPVMYRDLGGPV